MRLIVKPERDAVRIAEIEFGEIAVGTAQWGQAAVAHGFANSMR
jgi:hypothetical protein